MDARIGTMVALISLAATATAASQGRPSSVTMTCRETAGLVLARGAVVLGTGGQTFDRYVRDRGFCEATEIAVRGFVPTRDVPACFVGYRCREPTTGMFDDE